MTKLFVTFEGGDGSGKTTLIESLAKHLSNLDYSILITREPGGTKLGEHIRTLLLMQNSHSISARAELALFLASRAQHVEEVIRPALDAGKIVLCDRFNDSSIAYQGIARNLGEKEVKEACNFFSHYITPDLTLYLDLDPKIGFSRVKGEKDRIESEDISFHNKIRGAYKQIAEKEPHRFHIIDAAQSPEKVFKEAYGHVQKELI